MNVAFNEISFRPFFISGHQLKHSFLGLLKIYKRLQEEYAIDHLVFLGNIAEIKVLPEKTIYQWIGELNGLEKQQILSIIRRPFSDDVIISEAENLDSFTFENADLGIEEDYCIGLGLAYIQQTISLSLNSHTFWCGNEIDINKTDPETFETNIVNVFTIADWNSLNQTILHFLEQYRSIELVETDLEPGLKPIHIRADHGQDILEEFARRLVQSKYIIAVINSIQFNNRTSRFIRRKHSDGKIEFVLHWEDAGYGMVIQTTGRNYHETAAIAELLRNRFDR